MTESAEFMQRVDAKLDHAQATLDRNGQLLGELRAMTGPDRPVTEPDHPATKADVHAMVGQMTWRFAAMVAVIVLAVLILWLSQP
jgi:hypothetical protein